MVRDYDEVLSVKLCCAGVIICDVIMVMSLMYHFIQTSYMSDDVTNFRHYITYTVICIVSILLTYLIEKGNRICWIVCMLMTLAGLINIILEFSLTANVILALVMIIIMLLLLMMPPVCRKCSIPILMKAPRSES